MSDLFMSRVALERRHRIEALEAEVERLRGACKAIAALDSENWCDETDGKKALCDQMQGIARAALEPSP